LKESEIPKSLYRKLSIVAEINNKIVGHLLLSKAMVEDEEKVYTVIVLAPIAVKPGYQKQGIGSNLINEGS
jgi:putative acetyltransferase